MKVIDLQDSGRYLGVFVSVHPLEVEVGGVGGCDESKNGVWSLREVGQVWDGRRRHEGKRSGRGKRRERLMQKGRPRCGRFKVVSRRVGLELRLPTSIFPRSTCNHGCPRLRYIFACKLHQEGIIQDPEKKKKSHTISPGVLST